MKLISRLFKPITDLFWKKTDILLSNKSCTWNKINISKIKIFIRLVFIFSLFLLKNLLISEKLVSKIIFIVESELILKRFNRWCFQHMIHYTYNSAPFLQESTWNYNKICRAFFVSCCWHSIKHVGTFANKRTGLRYSKIAHLCRGGANGGAQRILPSLHWSKKSLQLQHAGTF